MYFHAISCIFIHFHVFSISDFSNLIRGIAWLFMISMIWLWMQTSVLARLWSKWQLLPWSQSARLDDLDANIVYSFHICLTACLIMFDNGWSCSEILLDSVRFCLIASSSAPYIILQSLASYASTSKALDFVAYETVSLCLALRWFHLQRFERHTEIKQGLKRDKSCQTLSNYITNKLIE